MTIGGKRLIVSLRPEDIALHVQQPRDTAGINLFAAEVIDTVYLGNFLECRVRVGRHEIGIQIDHYERLASGQIVFLSFRPEHGLCLAG